MKFFLKLNVVSALYALLFFISIELHVNFYRICRLTGWEGTTVNKVTMGIHLIGLIITTMIVFFLIREWLEGKKSSLWSIIFWVPYMVLFVRTFAFLFPITDRGEIPTPATGLIIIFEFIFYLCYLFVIHFFTIFITKDKDR